MTGDLSAVVILNVTKKERIHIRHRIIGMVLVLIISVVISTHCHVEGVAMQCAPANGFGKCHVALGR